MTADILYLGDRRAWPCAQQAWQDGVPARSVEGLSAFACEDWRQSMRRLAARLGVPVETSATRARGGWVGTAVANHGVPLECGTAAERDAWLDAQTTRQ